MGGWGEREQRGDGERGTKGFKGKTVLRVKVTMEFGVCFSVASKMIGGKQDGYTVKYPTL